MLVGLRRASWRSLATAVAGVAAAAALLLVARGPQPGPLRLGPDDRLLDERQAYGRTWRVYGDCPAARNTTWTSDDGGSTWLRHDGPGVVSCTVASGVRLRPTSRTRATADVDHGPKPDHEVWRTSDGGTTWEMTSTDVGG